MRGLFSVGGTLGGAGPSALLSGEGLHFLGLPEPPATRTF